MEAKDVILGILFAICLGGVYYMFAHSTFLRYRPWLIEPAGLAMSVVVDVLVILYVLRMGRGRPWWRLIWPGSAWRALKECLLSVKYLFVVFLIMIPVGILMDKTVGVSSESTRFLWVSSAPSSLYSAAIIVSMFTLAPVAEEFFFRGFLYSALRSRFSLLWAALVQAVIFCIPHGENLFGSLVIFALGVAFAVLYERRRNLLSPILLHAIKTAWLVSRCSFSPA